MHITHTYSDIRHSTRRTRTKVPFSGSVGERDSPSGYGVIPAAPHPTDVLRLEEVLAVVIEEIPECLFGGDGGDDVRTVWCELFFVARPAGLIKSFFL